MRPRALHYQGHRYVRVAEFPGVHDVYLSPHGWSLEVYRAEDPRAPDEYTLLGTVRAAPAAPHAWQDFLPAQSPRRAVECGDPLKDPAGFLRALKAARHLPAEVTGVWLWAPYETPKKLL